MRIVVVASGSGGNCTLVSDHGTKLLIDAGISMRRVENCLARAGFTIDDISGVLITHEHADHISGLKTILRYHRVALCAPHTVAARVCGMIPEAEDQMHIIPVGTPFPVGSLKVRAFHTPHDTDESVGYRLEGSGCFALATDMGMVTDEVFSGLVGAGMVLIESNHDVDMLCNGSYPAYLKRRILSGRGHLSNADCSALAARLVREGTDTIILGHLSRENNQPAVALAETGNVLEGYAVRLCCAPELGFLSLETGETK